jgi:murein L,D-transpeptidase YafK
MKLVIVNNGKIIASFEICSLANRFGPKTKAGDMKTLEGTYRISFINRKSASYKTIGINYPNAEDRKLGRTGGGIGIHRKCCSSGCIGMMNQDMDKIIWILDSLKGKTCPAVILPAKLAGMRKKGG